MGILHSVPNIIRTMSCIRSLFVFISANHSAMGTFFIVSRITIRLQFPSFVPISLRLTLITFSFSTMGTSIVPLSFVVIVACYIFRIFTFNDGKPITISTELNFGIFFATRARCAYIRSKKKSLACLLLIAISIPLYKITIYIMARIVKRNMA